MLFHWSEPTCQATIRSELCLVVVTGKIHRETETEGELEMAFDQQTDYSVESQEDRG